MPNWVRSPRSSANESVYTDGVAGETTSSQPGGSAPGSSRSGVRPKRSERVEAILADLTIAEKADLITGRSNWATRSVERAGIPPIVVTDGPNGARGGGLFGTGTPTACIPAGSVLGATWDPSLVERLGILVGEEAKAKGAQVLLAPTINLHRNPLGGRNFECFSEDPQLSGRIAAAYVRGVQSQGVATTPKHFVANDSEFERNTIDVQVDERTLREVYLLPFEHAVRDGGTWGLMSSYNRINGVFASENEWLLGSVLRDEWGFDGIVVSDWFALRATAASILAGTSLEMPGPGSWYGPERVAEAITAGEMDEAHLDAVAADMLGLIERTGRLDAADAGRVEEKPLDRPGDRTLVREAAIAGTVLITNKQSVLPLDLASLTSVAVIGPNAKDARIMGGGSATVRPYRSISPLTALTERVGDHATVQFARGCNIDRSVRALAAPILDAPMRLDFYDGHETPATDREPTAVSVTETADLLFFGQPIDGVDAHAYSVRAVGTLTPEMSGTHQLRMVLAGRARVLVDGTAVLDVTEGDIEAGDTYFGFGSAEMSVDVELEGGRQVDFIIEYSNRDAVLLAGIRVGLTPPTEPDLLAEAEQLAASSDVAIVVVGTNDDWETEGRDRDHFDLPGDQPELIRRVAAVNDRTIVVVNTGGPHGMDWLDEPAAVLSVGFGGQELGDALVDVLLGDADPGGRMPTTIPQRYEQSPAYLNYPGENSVVRYGEGLFIGHRFFDARHIAPRVAFGHGLSYATFEWSTIRVLAAPESSDVSAPVVVEVDVTNTSDRAGVDVVQLYIEPPASTPLQRPVRELKAFAKVQIGAGETATARLELDRRSFAYFDPGDPDFKTLAENGPVPAKGEQRRQVEAGWYVEPGIYRLVVARSAIDHVSHLDLKLR